MIMGLDDLPWKPIVIALIVIVGGLGLLVLGFSIVNYFASL